MRLAEKIVVPTIFLFALVFLCFSCGSRRSTVRTDSISGDYLFDGMSFDAVFYMTIYKDDGNLYALFEMSDYPVEMEKLKSNPPTYRIRFKSTGGFNLVFSDMENGCYSTLTMKSNDSDFEMDGFRHSSDMSSLREYDYKSRKKYVYRRPIKLGDGLETGGIQETSIDTVALYSMMNDILENYDYMHSMLIIKGGKLVVEEYFNGWDPVRLHRLQSVTKSYTSTLVGIALQHGYIENIDDPIYKYLPRYDSLLTGEKREITIKHLLTMSAGFEWNEDATYYVAPEECDAHLAGASGDYIKYVLEKPLVNVPGQLYNYNSGFPNILGHIVAERSGMRILKFAFDNLFGPLGMKRAYWWRRQPESEYRPGCAGGLRLTSRDMAKYGLLYLNGGVWNGKQIVNEDWIRASIEGKMESGHGTRYGYFWMSIRSLDGKHEIFFASGTGGQYIACIPDLDAVVVTTAVFNTDKGDAVAMLLLEQLIPALAGY
jgi:hypothetical protein